MPLGTPGNIEGRYRERTVAYPEVTFSLTHETREI